MSEHTHEPMIEDEIHYCEKHPDRDTELRCNRCSRYMCVECAVRTSVGYTCKECVRGHEDKFYNSTEIDYGIVAAVSAVGGAVGAFVIGLIGGFFIFTLIAAPAIGGMIGQLALNVTGRRRGRQSGYFCAGGVLVGGIVTGLLFTGFGITTLLYLALATPAAYASFRVSI